MLRILYKLPGMFLIVAYLIATSAFAEIFIRDPIERRKFRVRMKSLMARCTVRLLNIKIVFDNLEALKADKTTLIVSNHMSYVDVFVIASILPTAFVTSVEVEKTFLGTIAGAGGSFFVERRNPSRLLKEIEQIAKLLSAGIRIAVFPEGTTSNGEQLLPFKRALLQAALHSKVDILPLCLNYTKTNGDPITPESRDAICYYGTMNFLPHIGRLFRLESLEVKVSVLPEIQSADFYTSRELVERTYEAVHQAFEPLFAGVSENTAGT